jgi:dienelactone hydrolase
MNTLQRVLWGLVWGAVGSYLVVLGYLFVMQNALFWPATVNATTPPTPEAGNYQRLALTMNDGVVLNGIITPRVGVAPSPTLVVAFGGNAHDVGGLTLFLKQKVWPEENVVVAGIAYRGYPIAANPDNGGKSGGKPGQEAVLSDALAQVAALQKLVQPAKTIVLGYSIGGGVAAYVASQQTVSNQLAGVVLIAPFASLTALAQAQYPWLPVSLLMRHPMPTAQWLAKSKAPVFLITTPDDGLIPPSHRPILMQAAGTRLKLDAQLPGSTHGTILDDARFPGVLRMALLQNLGTQAPQVGGIPASAPFAQAQGNAISNSNP